MEYEEIKIKGMEFEIQSNSDEVEWYFQRELEISVRNKPEDMEVDDVLKELGIESYRDKDGIYEYSGEGYELVSINDYSTTMDIYFKGYFPPEDSYEIYRDGVSNKLFEDREKLEKTGELEKIKKEWDSKINQELKELLEEGYELEELEDNYERVLFDNLIDNIFDDIVISELQYHSTESLREIFTGKYLGEDYNFFKSNIETYFESYIENYGWNN